MKFFNKESDWTEKMFLDSLAYSLLCRIDTKMWIHEDAMTEEEKENYPSYKTSGGYLKDIPFKEAFANSWHNWNSRYKDAFTNLPNFDAEIFKQITSVEL